MTVGVETEGLEVWDPNEDGWVSAPAEPMVVSGSEQEQAPSDADKYQRPHPAEHQRRTSVTTRVDAHPELQDPPTGRDDVNRFTQQAGGTARPPASAPAASVNRTSSPTPTRHIDR